MVVIFLRQFFAYRMFFGLNVNSFSQKDIGFYFWREHDGEKHRNTCKGPQNLFHKKRLDFISEGNRMEKSTGICVKGPRIVNMTGNQVRFAPLHVIMTWVHREWLRFTFPCWKTQINPFSRYCSYLAANFPMVMSQGFNSDTVWVDSLRQLSQILYESDTDSLCILFRST